MKMFLKLLVLAVILAGCSKSLDSRSKTFTYPLQPGDSWNYRYSFFRQGADTTIPADTQFMSAWEVLVERVDTVPPGVAAYTVRATIVGSDTTGRVSRRTYINLPEGLYLLSQSASETGGISHVLMRRVISDDGLSIGAYFLSGTVGTGMAAGLGDPMFSIGAWSAGNADTMPLVFAYPQHRGLFWRAHDSGAMWSYALDKQIEGRETITTPAGSFDCWRIRCIYGPPYTWYKELEYISDQGLVRRRVEVAESTGRVVMIYELVSVALH